MREVFKKKFLVVGGRGFIGRALVRRLLELGRRGCLRAKQDFSWEIVVEKTMAILSAVV